MKQHDYGGDHIPSDELFAALADRNRRKVLFHLRQNRLATTEELAAIAAEDDETTTRDHLLDDHLPMLEDIGLVSYDRFADQVELTANPDEVGAWLDLAMRRDLKTAQRATNVPRPTATRPRPESDDDRIHVLLVDDSMDFVSAMGDLLEREHDDLSVATATSAPDAFTVLKSEPVDCVVSDYKMPGIDGIEFLDAVGEEYPDVSFILLTNKGSEQAAGEAIAIGASDFVRKETTPEGYDRLARSIRDAVAGDE
ncbi:response regulator [Halomarina litorea]|uniref:response regulator n=1 Tax=Halomarina litorea TaxID=2961595 RepID=UPI0020C29DA0|nr:response regulator [Halomarina sp. BCD28]